MKDNRNPFLSNTHGGVSIGLVLWGLLAAALIYIGFRVFPIYDRYWEVEGLMIAQARKADEFTDSEIRKNVSERIVELGIPIAKPKEALRINRSYNNIKLSLKYEEIFDIQVGQHYQVLYVFPFDINVEADIRR
ncbi:hypothetical protein JNK13_09375 [bacterium]|nr:hypothetical protein [bacterium]